MSAAMGGKTHSAPRGKQAVSGSIHAWTYRDHPVDVLEIGMSYAVLQRGTARPFVIGAAGIERWLR